MANPIEKLERMYTQQSRYATFGPTINKMKINGFRGINNFEINFDFPITAISGLNGSGKSSICQIASCAYKEPEESLSYQRYYLKDFFPVSVLDPTPFIIGSNVEYQYQSDVAGTNKVLTITRMKSEWSGYKRQPEKHCYYIGFTIYIPKVERRDLSIYFGTKLDRKIIREITPEISNYISTIIDKAYDQIKFEELTYRSKSRKQNLTIGVVKKGEFEYSENHMGFGEARILYIVDLLESAPDKSLFILEEPETSLHEDAQHKLIRYLFDVCIRKKHQIIISTHSSTILNVLPPIARICLLRNSNSLDKIEGASAQRIKSILSKGRDEALTIICEDSIAKSIIEELLRIYASDILRNIGIFDVGNIDTIKKTIQVTQTIPGFHVLGILDTETQVANQENLISLPGHLRPEQEILSPPEVIEYLTNELSVDVNQILTLNGELNHHELLGIISHEANVQSNRVIMMAITKYVLIKGAAFFSSIIEKIREKI